MNTPKPEGVDQEWWSTKTEERARNYCPGCELDVDPIRECVVVSYCRDHDPLLQGRLDGSADTLVRLPYVAPVTENVGESYPP